jgi:hypothetical protein
MISSNRVLALVYTRSNKSLPFSMNRVKIFCVFWDFCLYLLGFSS